ncbi:MAG: NTP transferase domain-containing protein [Flavobacteriales bacterium]|nr:NTP transferase domain-containing protein [Flavobacteriales bacterium]
MTNPSLVILAAGMGSRYGGLKQLDQLGPAGETIIDYSIHDALEAGFKKIVFVIRKSFEKEFKEKISNKIAGKAEVCHVFQEFDSKIEGLDVDVPVREKPWGTGHAIMVCESVVKEPFAVINADDFYGKDGFVQIYNFLTTEVSPSHYGMVGYSLNKTLSENGYVSRGVCQTRNGFLEEISERTKIKKENDGIFYEDGDQKHPLKEDSVVSMNFWGFHQTIFPHLKESFSRFLKTKSQDPKAEFFIPIIVDELIKSGQLKLKVLTSSDQWYGVTYKEDKEMVMSVFASFSNKGAYKVPVM